LYIFEFVELFNQDGLFISDVSLLNTVFIKHSKGLFIFKSGVVQMQVNTLNDKLAQSTLKKIINWLNTF
jgi:hypothetical protein